MVDAVVLDESQWLSHACQPACRLDLARASLAIRYRPNDRTPIPAETLEFLQAVTWAVSLLPSRLPL